MAQSQPACKKCALDGALEINQLPDETEVVADFASYNPKSRLYPTETELIHLVCLQYELDIGDRCIHDCHKRREGLLNRVTSKLPLVGPTNAKYIGKLCDYLDGRDRKWRLLAVFCQESRLGTQHGAAFFNTESNQLVIVHRGTQFTNLDSLRADSNEVVQQEIGRFGYVAYSFTKQIVEQFGAGAVSITVTGHSLGGWLAQVATFYLKYPQYRDSTLLNDTSFQVWSHDMQTYGAVSCDKLVKPSYHLHCVSFDGPGCKEVITKMFPKYGDDRKLTFEVLDSLDISVYLTRLNFTNIVNEQIGSVFQMKCESIFAAEPNPEDLQAKGNRAKAFDRVTCKGTRDWVKRFLKSHQSSKILQFWIKYESEGPTAVQAQVIQVTDWLTAESAWHYKKSMSINESSLPEFQVRKLLEFRMSIFSQAERDKIEMLAYCIKHFMNDEVWTRMRDDHDCVRVLTTGFGCLHDFQILKIGNGSETQDKEALYRDYFIRMLKCAVRKTEVLKISCVPPKYLEDVYTWQTNDFVKELPKFRDTQTNVGPFQFILDKFTANSNESRIFSVQVPKDSTRICTAKIYQLLRAECFREQLQYFVLNSRQLAKLGHILDNVDMNPFLPNLKCVAIECINEFDLPLVQSWVDRLCMRSKIWTRAIVVHSLRRDTPILTNTSWELGQTPVVEVRVVNERQVKDLHRNLDVESLVRDSTIDFKLKGNKIRLSDLVPLSNKEFYNSLDTSKLYSVFEKGSLGSLLPQLNSFEESYYRYVPLGTFLTRKFTGTQVTDASQVGQDRGRLTIITDEPGMGKTTLMQKLATYSQKFMGKVQGLEVRLPWTIFVSLDKVREVLRHNLATPVSVAQVVKVLATIESGRGDVTGKESIIASFIQELLKPNKPERVQVFFDGLDEINDDLKSFVLEMTETLLRESNARIFIAGRKRLTEELRTRFKIPDLKLKPFTKDERVEFLVKYWTNHPEFRDLKYDEILDEEGCQPFVNAFLEMFSKAIGSEAEKFVGIPFQLRMLAVAYMREHFFNFCEKCAESPSQRLSKVELDSFLPAFTNVAELYRLFVRTKIEEALKEKYKIDPEQEFTGFEGKVEELSIVHRLAGFDKIFCAKQRKHLTGQNPLCYPSKKQVEAIHCAGLISHYLSEPQSEIESGRSDETEFVHRTIAEFLSAEFILENMTRNTSLSIKDPLPRPGPEMQSFLDGNLLLPSNDNVFNFLNMLIMYHDSTPKIFRTVPDLSGRLEEVVAYLNNGGVDQDCLGRNLLHYIIIMHQLFDGDSKPNWFLLDAEYLCEVRDVFNSTPFAYAFYYQKYLGYCATITPYAALSSLLLDCEQDEQGHNDDFPDPVHAFEGLGKAMFVMKRESGRDNFAQHATRFLQLTLAGTSTGCKSRSFLECRQGHLAEYAIALRRNACDALFRFGLSITERFPVQWALQLDGESRVEFVLELWQYGSWVGKLREVFEDDLFSYFQQDDFAAYKETFVCVDVDSSIRHVERETRLLKLFALKVAAQEPQDARNSRNALYRIWKTTEFVSLKFVKFRVYVWEEFFVSVFKLMPRESEREDNAVDRYELAIEPWLQEYTDTYACDKSSQKVLCMFITLCHLRNKVGRDAFISDQAEIIRDILDTTTVTPRGSGAIDEQVLDLYLDGLYRSHRGRTLLEQSNKDNVKEWLAIKTTSLVKF